MDDEKVSLRIATKELQEMDTFLANHPELGSRSLFIRTAVREYINRDAGVSAAGVGNGVFVRLTEPQLQAIDTQVGVTCLDREDFIRDLVKEELGTRGMAKDSVKAAFQVATSNIPQ